MYKRWRNLTEVAVQPEPLVAGWLAIRDIPWSSKGNGHKGDELARRGLVWTGRLLWKCGWLAPRSLEPRFRSSNQSQLSTRYRIEHSTEELDTNGLLAQLYGTEIMPLRRIRLNSRIWENARWCRQLSTFRSYRDSPSSNVTGEQSCQNYTAALEAAWESLRS